MILALAWTYVPVVVVVLFWAVAMRPALRLIHVTPNGAPCRRPSRARRPRTRVR